MMVAYSCQARFEKPIVDRVKGGTIRDVGKRRHVRPGEEIQLYVGMRTRACRLIARATCTDVTPIIVTITSYGIKPFVKIGIDYGESIPDLDAFAKGDGFRDWADLEDFWRKTHREACLGPWHGLWIRWNTETLVTP
jgi:hypothetical protein